MFGWALSARYFSLCSLWGEGWGGGRFFLGEKEVKEERERERRECSDQTRKPERSRREERRATKREMEKEREFKEGKE
eukprot:scaffold171653_cov29-Tisochrysis_lutea.AAC.1